MNFLNVKIKKFENYIIEKNNHIISSEIKMNNINNEVLINQKNTYYEIMIYRIIILISLIFVFIYNLLIYNIENYKHMIYILYNPFFILIYLLLKKNK